MTNAAKKLTAKYNGRCPVCGLGISQGETIAWERGEKAVHWDCHTKTLADCALLDARGSSREAARGVADGGSEIFELSLDDPSHPENAEEVLALIETGREDELIEWERRFAR